MAPSSALNDYIDGEAAAYRAYRTESAANSDRVRRRHFTWLRRTRALAHWLEDEGVTIPPSHFQSYPAPPKDRLEAGLPVKYQIRAYNILRDLARVQASCPELLADGSPRQRVLDMSSGGCGLYEALTTQGHAVRCLDYFPPDRPRRFGNAYALIHQLLNLEVAHFDGTIRPSPMATDSCDYVFCFQALDAYAPADQWIDAADDLLRIATKTVVVVLNPPSGHADFAASVDHLTKGIAERPLKVTAFSCPDTGLPGFRWDKRT